VVEVELDNRSGIPVDDAAAVALARRVLAAEQVESGELGLSFVRPGEIRALKRTHLGIDEETDVLSFPIDGRQSLPEGVPRQLGDVVICPQHTHDLLEAVVHGTLHLVGMDHESDSGEMLALQDELMAWLR